MPFGDRTGPRGRGPRTGRGLGDCTPSSSQQNDEDDRGFGRDQGRDFGRGIGFGRGFGRGQGRGRGRRR